ncbi:DNA repair protein RecO [Undibacterium luofuense]|uniref:DNA repair protein RecO n=1 Tax=Undibacterium luofuense TaxID=2828733 RepID=A0A941DP26_9BURK|nr:DNA repair protein RecO [Undibacterium luofuense]MBR7783335.1 DNA repair protein RecO [Undibacterium luofuense]
MTGSVPLDDDELAEWLAESPSVPATAIPRSAVQRKVLTQPGFVLHSRPYKETSLVIDVLTRDCGRIALIAKGAKRPYSQLRSVLQTFQPLQLSWTGKQDLKNLTQADWVGGMFPLEKSALVCGFYLNELMLKLLVRDDPHPALFQQYVSTLNQLAHGEPVALVLRQFELVLLKEAGLLGDLRFCSGSRMSVVPELAYVLDPDAGVRPAQHQEHLPVVSGACLLAMHEGDFREQQIQIQSKLLIRSLLQHHLHGAVLNTRQLLIDLQNLS